MLDSTELTRIVDATKAALLHFEGTIALLALGLFITVLICTAILYRAIDRKEDQ